MSPHRFRSSQFRDCASILPVELCEELELRRLARGAQPHVQPGLYSIREGSGKVAPGAVVIRDYTGKIKFEGYDLPGGWSPVGGKKVRKWSLGRFAIAWKRNGGYQIQLMYNGLAFLRSDGKSRFETIAEAIYTCELFLSDTDRNEFMAIREGGREVKKSKGGNMLSKNETPGLRRIIRASTIGVEKSRERAAQARASGGATRSPILKRQISAPVVRTQIKADPLTEANALKTAIAGALAEITAAVEGLRNQIESASVSVVRSSPRGRMPDVDYSALGHLNKSGVLQARSRAGLPSGRKMVVRAVPGSYQHGTGKPRYAETVSSAVRRSVGLNGLKVRKGRVRHSVRNAIAISNLQSQRAIAHVQGFPVGQRIVGGYRSRVTGGFFPTAAARDRHDQASDVTQNRLIPLEKPMTTANQKRMIPLAESEIKS